MKAGDVWQQFGRLVRPALDSNPHLESLEREALSGLSERVLLLVPLIAQIVRAFIKHLSSTPEFWYDDPLLAARYSGTQDAALPIRTDVAEQIARLAWASIEKTLETREKAYILDLGTGDGIMARTLLARRPAHVPRDRVVIVASDRSQAMLSQYANMFTELNIRTMPANDGDMRADSWCSLNSYHTLLGQDFEGFDVILGMMCFHILPKRETHLYPKIRDILRPDGHIIFAHDFFHEGEDWTNYAPTLTLIEGYRAYVKTSSRPITFRSYLGGFLLRRSILQGDNLCTLPEEVRAVRTSFQQVHTYRHAQYREFAVIVAGQEILPRSNTNDAFDNPDE